MSLAELLTGLVDEVPDPVRVEPFAFLADDLLPRGLTPVEPLAFALECLQAGWGPNGPRN